MGCNISLGLNTTVNMVKELTSTQEFKDAIAAEGLTVVDFFATWCGPCRAIAPYLDTLDSEFADVQFVKVNIDELEDVAQEHEISAMPTFVFFKAGKRVNEVVGADKAKLKAAIESSK